MTKIKKIVLGILTILPIFLLIIYFIAMFFSVFGLTFMAQHGNQPDSNLIFKSFAVIFVFFGLIFLLTIGMYIFYIMHAAKNPKFDESNRLIWILINIFGGHIGNIIYWYLHIWKEEEPKENLNSFK